MKKFLTELEQELRNRGIKDSEIAEIISDHEEMIQEALSEGLEESKIEEKFGSPAKIALELSETQKFETQNVQDSNDYTLHKSFPVLESSICVEIRFVEEDFHLEKSNSDSIEIYYKGKGKIEDYEISFDNGTLKINAPKLKKRLFVSFTNSSLEFLVKIPETLIERMNLVSVSSDITVDSITTQNFELHNTNGDVEFTNLDTSEFKLNTVNGDVSMTNLNANDLRFTSVNGEVSFENITVVNNVLINTVSGDFKIHKMECKECHFQSVSGDISAKEFYPNQISLKSVSGDVDIVNSDKTRNIQITNKKSVSGQINIR